MRSDQAAGLRRLLARERLRVLPVVAGARGAGKRTLLVGLACAAAAAGQRVVVLDPSAGEVPVALGLTWRRELAHLLSGEREYRDVLLHGPAGIGVVPAAKGIAAVLEAKRGGGELFDAFTRLASRPDLILINTPLRDGAACTLLPDAAELAVVTRADRDAVTATYARLKELVRRHARRRFRLIVNRASAEAGRALHAHMAGVARRFLGAELAWGGCLADESALRAGGPAAAVHRSGHFAELAQSVARWSLAEFACPGAA